MGLLFNRQFVFSRIDFDQKHHFYIVDFYCHEIRLIVEIDGAYHANPNQIELDQFRTETLEQMGLSLIRFSNEDVINNPEKVLQELYLFVRRIDS